MGGGSAGPAVDLDTRMPGTVARATYDVGTGALLRYQVQTRSNGTTVDLSLEAMP